jgi:hypothetical protein
MRKDKKIEEDMIAPADSPAYSAPSHQVPATASPGDNMDTFALSGPGKSKTSGSNSSKRNKKKEETTFPSNKVLSFQDFIKDKSTKK